MVYIGAVPDESNAKMYHDIRLRDVIGKQHLVDPNAEVGPGPHVQFTERPPGHVTDPHFHEVDQFQIYLDTGTLGKAPVKPGMIQYTKAHTPYGPLIAGDSGLKFLVMRATHDPGARYMPQERHLRRPVKPHNELMYLDLANPKNEHLTGPHGNGLDVFRQAVDGGATIEFSAPQNCAGQFGVVVSGSVVSDGKTYPQWSCVYADAGETMSDLRSGSEGADFLVLRFPLPS